MPRNLSSDMLAALSASVLYPAIFVQATFKSETVYLWSGVGSRTWNGQTWLGLGAFLGFSTPEDSAVVEAKGISIVLSGIDATLLPDVMNDFQLGAPVMLYLGLFDSGGTLIDDPVIAWAGRMDQPTIDVSGTDATLSINCENRLIDMNVAVDRRFTNQDQQRYVTEQLGAGSQPDLGLSFVDSITELTLFWGQRPMAQNNL